MSAVAGATSPRSNLVRNQARPSDTFTGHCCMLPPVLDDIANSLSPFLVDVSFLSPSNVSAADSILNLYRSIASSTRLVRANNVPISFCSAAIDIVENGAYGDGSLSTFTGDEEKVDCNCFPGR